MPYGFTVVTQMAAKVLPEAGVTVDGKARKVTGWGKSLEIGHEILLSPAPGHGTQFRPCLLKFRTVAAPVSADKFYASRGGHCFKVSIWFEFTEGL